jgi:hypothetical protein
MVVTLSQLSKMNIDFYTITLMVCKTMLWIAFSIVKQVNSNQYLLGQFLTFKKWNGSLKALN